jgi:hypothetical protein
VLPCGLRPGVDSVDRDGFQRLARQEHAQVVRISPGEIRCLLADVSYRLTRSFDRITARSQPRRRYQARA